MANLSIKACLILALLGTVVHPNSSWGTGSNNGIQIENLSFFCNLDSHSGTVSYYSNGGYVSDLQLSEAIGIIRLRRLEIIRAISLTRLNILLKRDPLRNRKRIRELRSEKLRWSRALKEITLCYLQSSPPQPSILPPSFPGHYPSGINLYVFNISNFVLLDGGRIIASDGTFLGIFTPNQGNQYSVANYLGNYGSALGNFSIFNSYCAYGSGYSNYSPWNSYASYPPVIIVGNTPMAFLTTNPYLSPRVNPYDLLRWIGRS